jgi:alpha-ketoglutarate-dependent taurine dioxygenase
MNMGCTVAALPSNSLDGACGKDFNAAGVTGVNCREKLSPDEVAAIEAGMDRYAVLIFHDQRITDEQKRLALADVFA